MHLRQQEEEISLRRLEIGLAMLDSWHAKRSSLIEDYVHGIGSFSYDNKVV